MILAHFWFIVNISFIYKYNEFWGCTKWQTLPNLELTLPWHINQNFGIRNSDLYIKTRLVHNVIWCNPKTHYDRILTFHSLSHTQMRCELTLPWHIKDKWSDILRCWLWFVLAMIWFGQTKVFRLLISKTTGLQVFFFIVISGQLHQLDVFVFTVSKCYWMQKLETGSSQ